jgi:hypothetical protein
MIIVADTSGLFAAFDAAQPEHDSAVAVVEHELLVISPMVLTELDHLVHRSVGFPAAMQVMAALPARLPTAPTSWASCDPQTSSLPRTSGPNTRISDWISPLRSELCLPTATGPTASLPSTSVTSAPSLR